jgi:hypothetical protein
MPCLSANDVGDNQIPDITLSNDAEYCTGSCNEEEIRSVDRHLDTLHRGKG